MAVEKMKTNKAEKSRIAAAKRAAKAMVEEVIADMGDTVDAAVESATAMGMGMGTGMGIAMRAQLRKRKNTTSSDVNAHITQRQRYIIHHVYKNITD